MPVLDETLFMNDTTCLHCGLAIEGQELYCPKCGKTTIPQLNKKDLQDLVDREGTRGLNVPLGIGCASGGVLGAAVLVLLLFMTGGDVSVIRGAGMATEETPSGWVDLGMRFVTAFLGGICGLII